MYILFHFTTVKAFSPAVLEQAHKRWIFEKCVVTFSTYTPTLLQYLLNLCYRCKTNVLTALKRLTYFIKP